MIQDQDAAVKVCEYILDHDKEKEDYIQNCEENGLDPYTENHTYHVYGAARAALGMDPLEKTEQVGTENPYSVPSHTDEVTEAKASTDELEAIVDKSSMASVLEELIGVAFEKAEHVRSNYQDEGLAKNWEKAGKFIDTATTGVKKLGV